METVWRYFGWQSEKQRLSRHQAALRKTIRTLSKQITELDNRESKLKSDIKKNVEAGQLGAARIQAKDLIRTQNGSKTFKELRGDMVALQLRLQTVGSNYTLTEAMKGASKVMATMNRNMNIAGIQKLSMEFEKEHDLMEQRQEVMSDAMEDLHGNDDPIADDMVDETLKQVLDGKKQSMGEVPQGIQGDAIPEGKIAQAVGGGGADPDDDLQARLNSLRK